MVIDWGRDAIFIGGFPVGPVREGPFGDLRTGKIKNDDDPKWDYYETEFFPKTTLEPSHGL